MKTGIEIIAEERQRHIEVEGWTPENDDEYEMDELAISAACYALPDRMRETDNAFVGKPKIWPWDRKWWKPSPENRIRELAKAGSMIAAEIDRIQRSREEIF